MKRTLLYLIAFLAVAGITGAVFPQFIRRVPELEVSTTRLNLGEGKPNQLVSGEIELRNVGSAALEFTIASSCGCTAVTPRKGTIAPKQVLPLVVSLTLPGYSKSEKTVQVIVNSNDPVHPHVNCSVLAKVPAPFEVTPAVVEFGHVAQESVDALAASLQVSLKPAEDRELRIRIVSGSFSATLTPEQTVRVTPAADLEFGDHYGTLELFLEGAENEVIRIPLHLHIEHPFSTVPSSFIVRKDANAKYRPLEWIAIANTHGPPIGELKLLDRSESFTIANIGQLDSHRHRYRLTINDDWQASSGRESITIENSASGHRCQIHLFSKQP